MGIFLNHSEWLYSSRTDLKTALESFDFNEGSDAAGAHWVHVYKQAQSAWKYES